MQRVNRNKKAMSEFQKMLTGIVMAVAGFITES